MDKWLTHNNFAKVLALFLSIILWAMVHLDSGTPVDSTTLAQPRIIDNVKIEVTGFDENKYVLYDLEPDSVRMEVKGKRIDLTTNFSDYKVRLNLDNVGPGTFTLPLTHELPPGVQLISMDPSIVKVTIEAKETQTVPVSIVVKGEPADGLVAGIPIVDGGGNVDVTLPASQIEELGKVQGVVDISGLKDSVKGKSVKLTAYDKQGDPIDNAEISPASIDVDVPINKRYKNVPLEVRQTGSLPHGYMLEGIQTDVEGVALYGPKEALESISSYPITVDLSRFDGSETSKQFSIELTPPEGFEKIEPGSVTITLDIKPAAEQQIEGVPVSLLNLNPLYDVKWVRPADQKLTLTLSGTLEALDQLRLEDIHLTADLSPLGVGTHTIPVEMTLPAHVKMADPALALMVEVELTEKGSPTTGGTEDTPDSSTNEQNSSENEPPPTSEKNQEQVPDNASPSGNGT